MSALPRPATVTDVYLHDIAASLRQINLSLAQLVTLSTPQVGPLGDEDLDPVQLREPESAPVGKRRKG